MSTTSICVRYQIRMKRERQKILCHDQNIRNGFVNMMLFRMILINPGLFCKAEGEARVVVDLGSLQKSFFLMSLFAFSFS